MSESIKHNIAFVTGRFFYGTPLAIRNPLKMRHIEPDAAFGVCDFRQIRDIRDKANAVKPR